MKTFSLLCAGLWLCLCGINAAQALVIDSFGGEGLPGCTSPSIPGTACLSDGEALTGEFDGGTGTVGTYRDVRLVAQGDGGFGDLLASINKDDDSRFSFLNAAGATSRAILTYNGSDNSGLGGIDLTEGGINFGFIFDVLFTNLMATLQVQVFSNTTGRLPPVADPNLDQTQAIAEITTAGLNNSETVEIAFSDFTINDPGFSFSNVSAIRIVVKAPDNPGFDLIINDIYVSVPLPATHFILGLGLATIILLRRKIGYSKRIQSSCPI